MDYGRDYQGEGGDNYGGGFSTGGDAYNNAGGGFPSSSQGSGGGGGNARKNYDENTILPVTVRMLLMSNPDPTDSNQLMLEDDRKIYRFKLVAAIRNVEQNSTNVMYQLEDGTGMVEVKQWIDENACSKQQEIMQSAQEKEHQYVKVIGQLKMFDGNRSVIAQSVRPLKTGNELTHHFLDVVYSGEKYKHNSTIVGGQRHGGPMGSPMMGVTHTNNMYNSGGGVGFGGGPGGGTGRTPVQMDQGDGNAVKQAVAAFVQDKGDAHEYGANINDCINYLGASYSEAEIRMAIDSLQQDGSIYSTVNEDNYKSAM